MAYVLFISPAIADDSYKISPEKSKITFNIKNRRSPQSPVENVPGSFTQFSGTLDLGPNPSVQVEVKTTSVDTANMKRDKHLRNQDFFKVKEYPIMSFKSTSMKKTSDDTYDVIGDFTLLGKTKAIKLTFKLTGPHAGTASFQIKRSDYGMTFRLPATADEINVTLNIVGVK